MTSPAKLNSQTTSNGSRCITRSLTPPQVGFMDMQTMSVDNNSLVTAPVDPGTPNAPPYPAGADLGYAVHSPPSLEASFMGTLLLGVAIAHLFLDGSLAVGTCLHGLAGAGLRA